MAKVANLTDIFIKMGSHSALNVGTAGDIKMNLTPLSYDDTIFCPRVLDLAKMGYGYEKISKMLLLTPKSVKRYLKRVERLEMQERASRIYREAKKKFHSDRREQLQKFVNDGMILKDIAKHMGITKARVHQLLKELKVPYHTMKPHVSDALRQEIISHYMAGMGVRSIAKLKAYTFDFVNGIIRNNITKEQRAIGIRMRRNIDRIKRENMFRNLSEKFRAGATLEDLAIENGFSVRYLHLRISPYLSKVEKRECRNQLWIYRSPTSKTKYADSDIIKYYSSGMSPKDIAKKLGCSRALVYQRINCLKLLLKHTESSDFLEVIKSREE